MFLSSSAYAKKFVIILNGEIVHKYEDEKERVYGGDWSKGIHYDVSALEIEAVIYENDEIQESEEILLEIEKRNAKRLIELNRSNGQKIINEAIYLNSVRQISNENKLAFLALPAVIQIIRLLETGNISLARSQILSVEADGEVVTSDLKTGIVSYMDSLL